MLVGSAPGHRRMMTAGHHLTAADEASRPFYLKTFWKMTLLGRAVHVDPRGLTALGFSA